MRIKVTSGIDDLASDLVAIRTEAKAEMPKVVSSGLRAGNTLARDFATKSAGKHGKHYPKAFSTEMHAGGGLFGNTISGEYGPDASRPQGGMSFERGSRNQKPHLDLARSADIIGPSFSQEVGQMIDRLFW